MMGADVEKEESRLAGIWTEIKPKLPLAFMAIVGSISLYFSLYGFFNYLFLTIGQFTYYIPTFILFGDPTEPNTLVFFGITVFLIIGWLFSTKFERFQSKRWRVVWFFNMIAGILFHYLWLSSAAVYNYLLPLLSRQISLLDYNNNIWVALIIGDTTNLFIAIYFIPTVVVGVIMSWVTGQYRMYAEKINEEFFEFEFKNAMLQKWFATEKTEHWPDVVLGPETESRELVVQPGRDRTLNNIIVGSIGTGKTSALVLPIVNQDLHWMTKFINDYPKIFKREDYDTEQVKGMYLNGISIIEPSNDLCQKAYKLVKAHGIPDEAVFYIDPTNKDTPSINPMQGPVEKVAESFATVMEDLAEGGQSNFFFQQSERNHLKHYIYLLKLHEPGKEVTFDMLLRMYNNPNYAHEMHMKLKKTYPPNLDQLTDRDEINHWAIVRQIDEWFDMNLRPRTEGRNGAPVLIKDGEYRGQVEYYDAKAEYVQGLRNVLNDIGANPLIRRVLFGKTNFDFDRHMEMGGVLLVNTAKGELGQLSNVLGKLVILSLQNAVFRRKPNVSTFHHIIIDEFPDYIYRSFKEFPAQSRKYKTIVTVVAQTISQLADKYGETYMQTLLGTLRHKMVYGDIPYYDAQLFSKIFGEEDRYEETITEQAVSALQENPMLRTGSSFSKKTEPILSPSDIIYQKPFQCAVKIVEHNTPMPVRQIDANFVNEEEFEKAVVQVEPKAADFWLEQRRKLKTPFSYFVEEPVEPDPDISNEIKYTELNGINGEVGATVEAVGENNLEEGTTTSEIDHPTVDGPVLIESGAVGSQESTITDDMNVVGDVEGSEVAVDLGDLFGPEETKLGEEHQEFMEELSKELAEVPDGKKENKPSKQNKNIDEKLESLSDLFDLD